jgi:hypothetical protein
MKNILVVISALILSGCAYYLTPRPPIAERKLGAPGRESLGALATAADYRMIFVRIDKDARFCAEPPPDAAGQFAAILAAEAKGPAGDKEISAELQASVALSMKQLFQRTQGVQFYRDGQFSLCNLYLNGAISEEEYVHEVSSLRESAARLIELEIPHLQKLSFDPIVAPQLFSPKPDGEAEPPKQTNAE